MVMKTLHRMLVDQSPTGEREVAHTCAKQAIQPGQLTGHADRGAAMTSKPVALLLADLASPRPIVATRSPTTIRFPKPSSRP